MKKILTKNQRRKRNNDIKILVYYSIAKLAQAVTTASVIMLVLGMGADIEFSSAFNIITWCAIAIALLVSSNFIASRLSRYLYKKHAISKSRVINDWFSCR